jgi:AcrR family transcriptional regulator
MTTPQQKHERTGSGDDVDRAAAPAVSVQRALLQPNRELTTKITMAFLHFGYETMTMVSLAKACEFSRPALYQYFQNKEQAFRFSTRAVNIRAIDSAFALGEKLMREGRPATDVFAEVTFARYALMRTADLQSPHRVELNAAAARKCGDLLIEVSLMFRDRLTELLAKQFSAGRMTPRKGVATTEIAQALADGARGVDQSLPPPAPEELLARHRWMVRAVLYGCITETTGAGGR